MKQFLVALAVNPLSYVLLFGIAGASSVVAGIAILSGTGWAMVASGCFLIAGAGFITKGMTSDG